MSFTKLLANCPSSKTVLTWGWVYCAEWNPYLNMKSLFSAYVKFLSEVKSGGSNLHSRYQELGGQTNPHIPSACFVTVKLQIIHWHSPMRSSQCAMSQAARATLLSLVEDDQATSLVSEDNHDRWEIRRLRNPVRSLSVSWAEYLQANSSGLIIRLCCFTVHRVWCSVPNLDWIRKYPLHPASIHTGAQLHAVKTKRPCFWSKRRWVNMPALTQNPPWPSSWVTSDFNRRYWPGNISTAPSSEQHWFRVQCHQCEPCRMLVTW